MGSSIIGDVLSSMVADIAPQNYPPANIMKINTDGTPLYRLELGIPGFKKEEIDVQLHTDKKTLEIKGSKDKKSDQEKEKIEYLSQKLAQRSFVYKLLVPDYTEILSANLSDGILSLDMTVNAPEKASVKVDIN
jgi:HSP20 family molecular chaperone IbpA